MTLNDIISKRIAIKEFYFRYLMNMGTSIAEASKEPLKLREVASMGSRPILPTGEPVDYATAMCFVCLQTLVGKFSRRNKPIDAEIAYMAKQMGSRYLDWSVLDLPTFVDMCLCSRIWLISIKASSTVITLLFYFFHISLTDSEDAFCCAGLRPNLFSLLAHFARRRGRFQTFSISNRILRPPSLYSLQ